MRYKCQEVSLLDISTALSDGLHKAPKFCVNGDYLFVNATNLENGYIVEKDQEKRTTYQEFCKYGVPLTERTILYSIDGTIGNIARYRGEKCVLGKGACYITICEDVDVDYIYYQLQSPHFKNYIDLMSTGSTIKHISLKTMRNYTFLLPALDIQRKISRILSALDDKIELNQKINDNLQQQVQALFKAWFVNFEPFGWSVPDDWKYYNFSTFLTPRNEKSNDPALPMFSVTDTGIFPRDEKFKKKLSMTNAKSKVVHQTDLVFGMSREILNWGIMRQPIGGVSSAYNVYEVNKLVDSFYLEAYMKANTQYFKDLIKPASREGQGIDKNALMQKSILMPTQVVLEKYYIIEEPLTQSLLHIVEENKRLVQLRDTLIPKLMSGEIDVSNIQV